MDLTDHTKSREKDKSWSEENSRGRGDSERDPSVLYFSFFPNGKT